MKDIIGMLVPVFLLIYLGIESAFPARTFPEKKGWKLRGFCVFLSTAMVSTVVPLIIPVDWLRSHRLIDGAQLGITGGVVVGFISVSFFNYWWHRLEHKVDWIWRNFHQFHHSPQRLDVFVAMYFHPFDIFSYSLISLVVTTFIIGLDPLAAALTGLVGATSVMLTHSNVRTPTWLGFFIQRPEAHLLHHQRDVHTGNFTDFPFWDVLFGTYRKPEGVYQGDVGFDHDANLLDMLKGIDVNGPGYDKGRPSVAPANAAWDGGPIQDGGAKHGN